MAKKDIMRSTYHVFPNGRKVHFNKFNQYHNSYGPAISHNGKLEFWLFDIKMTKQEHERFMKTNLLPIVNVDGSQVWINGNGKRHRTDGPAYIDFAGIEFYYVDGKEYTQEDYQRKFAEKVKISA